MKQETVDKLCKKFGFHSEQAKEMAYRRTGRSTARALEAIAEALRKPGEEISVCDHHGTPQSDRMLLDTIHEMVTRLELVGFHMKASGRPTLKFDLAKLQVKHFGFALK